MRRSAADILVIDSVVRRGTIMYLLDQRHFDGMNDPGYLWVGEGTSLARAPSYDPAGSLEPTHFEIPLAEFGVSCASQATVDFSPYTQGLQGGATLYPIATFVVDRGRIRLPMTILGDFDHATDALPWLPCPGALAARRLVRGSSRSKRRCRRPGTGSPTASARSAQVASPATISRR